MIGKHAENRPGMEWLEMDIRDLKFEDGSFDVVIDKVSPSRVGGQEIGLESSRTMLVFDVDAPDKMYDRRLTFVAMLSV
jgi:hypothetical protein